MPPTVYSPVYPMDEGIDPPWEDQHDTLGTPTASSGIPAGGTTGQHLIKHSDVDYDVEWVDFGMMVPVFTPTVDGLVPHPVVASGTKYLRDDGEWVVPTGSGSGLANAFDKVKVGAVTGTAGGSDTVEFASPDNSVTLSQATPKRVDMVVNGATFMKSVSGRWDGQSQPIGPIANAVNANDAATKAQLTTPFGAAGGSHAAGAVPDPGITAWADPAPKRVLLETGAWGALAAKDTTYTPSAPNTYPFTLYQDYEWDRVNTLAALTPAQRLNPIGVDCWQELQYLINWMMALNQNATDGATKHLRLVKAHLISQALTFTGFSTASVRQGRTIIVGGSLVAPATWAAQSNGALPMVIFSTDSQSSGSDGVYYNCNGVCSGILVDTTVGGNSKIQLTNNIIVNFANPQALTQAAIYDATKLVNIGTAASPVMVASVALRDYEKNTGTPGTPGPGQASPYGIRYGQKIIYAQGDSAMATDSATGRISGNMVRQWDVNRTEAKSWSKRTGIGIWIAVADLYLKGLENNVSDCLKALVNEGHSTIIDAFHSSPSGGGVILSQTPAWVSGTSYAVGQYVQYDPPGGGVNPSVYRNILAVSGTTVPASDPTHWTAQSGNGEYNINDAPTTDVQIVGTEQTSGHNSYIGNYHERQLWLRDKRATIALQRFPRNDGSTDGNLSSIMLDATGSNESIGTSGSKLIILGNHHDGAIDCLRYREADGHTFAGKIDTVAVGNFHLIFSAEQHVIASGATDTPVVVTFLSALATAAYAAFLPGQAALWTPSGPYIVGDIRRWYSNPADTTSKLINYIAKTANTDATFTSSKWTAVVPTNIGWFGTNGLNFSKDTTFVRSDLMNGGQIFNDALGATVIQGRTRAQLNALATVGPASIGRAFIVTDPTSGAKRLVVGDGTTSPSANGQWVDNANVVIATPV